MRSSEAMPGGYEITGNQLNDSVNRPMKTETGYQSGFID